MLEPYKIEVLCAWNDRDEGRQISIFLFLIFLLVFKKKIQRFSADKQRTAYDHWQKILSFSSSNKNVTVLIFSYFPLKSTCY